MQFASFLPLFVAIIVCSGGKAREKLKVINCTGIGPFKGAPAKEIYYHIVDNNRSACMHFVWSTVQSPTLYLAHTPNVSKSCSCEGSTFNRTAFLDGQNHTTVTIPGLDSTFSLAVVFTKMIEFNATKKSLAQEALNMTEICTNNETRVRFTDFANNDNITWKFSPENATFMGEIKYINASSNSTIKFGIRTKIPEFLKNSRLDYFPKTLFTVNSTTFDLVIEDFEYRMNSSNRIALEMVVIHGGNVRSGNITIKKTSDDEYTPSIFSTYTYNTSGKSSKLDPYGGYIQWKPISYQSAQRKSTSSQQAFVQESGSCKLCQLDQVPLGLGSALYGIDADKLTKAGGNVTRWFVVFGTSGDNSYINSPYYTWTVVAGYGIVPVDTLSHVVIITIIVGVGIPAALVVVGGIYVFIRKKPWQNVQRFINSRSGRGYSRLS